MGKKGGGGRRSHPPPPLPKGNGGSQGGGKVKGKSLGGGKGGGEAKAGGGDEEDKEVSSAIGGKACGGEVHGGDAMLKVAAKLDVPNGSSLPLGKTRSGKVLVGKMVSGGDVASLEVGTKASSSSSTSQALVVSCDGGKLRGGSNGRNGKEKSASNEEDGTIVLVEVATSRDECDSSSNEDETSSDEDETSNDEEEEVVAKKDLVLDSLVPNSFDDVAMEYVSQNDNVMFEKITPPSGHGNLSLSSSNVQDVHYKINEEGADVLKFIVGNQMKVTSPNVPSSRFEDGSKIPDFAEILGTQGGGVAAPASNFPARMEVGWACSFADVVRGEGAAVQSVAKVSNPTLIGPNTSKNSNPSHHSIAPSGADLNPLTLPHHLGGISNLAAQNKSLLGPPPPSSLTKALPNNNAWIRKSKLEFLPKIPSLAEITKDGSCVVMDEDSSSAHVEKLACALVGKTLGKTLPFLLLKSELKKNWSKYGNFTLSILSSNTFICFFSSQEIRDDIVLGGPWFAANQVLALDCWSESFDPKSLGGFSSPTWLRLPQLPLHYWTKQNLARIGSMLGDPLFVDETTMNWSRTEFARICVRLDFAKKIPSGIWIEGKTRKFFQPIVYEGLPKICFNCGFVGHDEDACTLHKIRPNTAPIAPSTNTLAKTSTPSPLVSNIPPPLSSTLPLTHPPHNSPHILASRPSAAPTLTPPLPNAPPPSTQPQPTHSPSNDSQPSQQLLGPREETTIPPLPLDDSWVVKRHRRFGAHKFQRKHHFLPWRRYLKPIKKFQQWRMVKEKETNVTKDLLNVVATSSHLGVNIVANVKDKTTIEMNNGVNNVAKVHSKATISMNNGLDNLVNVNTKADHEMNNGLDMDVRTHMALAVDDLALHEGSAKGRMEKHDKTSKVTGATNDGGDASPLVD